MNAGKNPSRLTLGILAGVSLLSVLSVAQANTTDLTLSDMSKVQSEQEKQIQSEKNLMNQQLQSLTDEMKKIEAATLMNKYLIDVSPMSQLGGGDGCVHGGVSAFNAPPPQVPASNVPYSRGTTVGVNSGGSASSMPGYIVSGGGSSSGTVTNSGGGAIATPSGVVLYQPVRGKTYNLGSEIASFPITITDGYQSFGAAYTSTNPVQKIVWISETPGGSPIDGRFIAQGYLEASVLASGGTVSTPSQGKLLSGSHYYLNVKNATLDNPNSNTCPSNCSFVLDVPNNMPS